MDHLYRISLITGILIVLLGMDGRLAAQEYEPWRKAVLQQYPEAEALLREKEVTLSFKRNRKTGWPAAVIAYKLRFSSTVPEKGHITYDILYDNHGTLYGLKTGHRKSRRHVPEPEPYSDGALVHSNILHTAVKVPLKKAPRQKLLRYKIAIDDIRYLPPLYFTSEWATYDAAIHIQIPVWVNLAVNDYNMEDSTRFPIQRTVDDKNFRSFTYVARALGPEVSVPAAPGRSHLYPHLVPVTRSFLDEGRWHDVFTGTDDLYSWYRKLLSEVPKEAELPASLNNGVTDSLEQVANVLQWVRSNIRYLAFENGIAGYQPAPPAEVLEKRYADCKGMALLTAELLRERGIEAYPGWLATRNLAYDYSLDGLVADNHMICVAFLQEDTLFLDATEPYAYLGEYSSNIAGKQVMVGKGDDFAVLEIPELPAREQVMEVDIDAEITQSGSINGAGILRANGAYKAGLVKAFQRNKKPGTAIAEYMSYPKAGFTVSDTLQGRIIPRPDPLEIPFGISFEAGTQNFEADYYLQPSSLSMALPALIDKRRNIPYLLDHPGVIRRNWHITIPAGYQVNEQAVKRAWTSECLSATWQQMADGDGLHFSLQLTFPEDQVPVDCFGSWNRVLSELNELLNAYVILKKY